MAHLIYLIRYLMLSPYPLPGFLDFFRAWLMPATAGQPEVSRRVAVSLVAEITYKFHVEFEVHLKCISTC